MFRARRRGGVAAPAVVVAVVLCATAVGVACGSGSSGGSSRAAASTRGPFHRPTAQLSAAELQRFNAGATVFDATVPASKQGDRFNDNGCLGCHRDRAPEASLSSGQPAGLVARLGPDPTYGMQLQTRGPGAEGTVKLSAESVTHRWADGTETQLRRWLPEWQLLRGPFAEGTAVSFRRAPSMIGLGLLEAIPEAALRAAAAAQPASGVSGRVAELPRPGGGEPLVGRFGWKASQATIADQTDLALREDIGVVSAPAALTPTQLADLNFYNRTVAVPPLRSDGSSAVVRGAAVFESVGCAACHTPTQHSGDAAVAALAHQTFHPYTDLLLHDLGPGLADNRPEGAASGVEWRTAPLWGISRQAEVTGSPGLLHDGRARDVVEAVLWHDGEARSARLAFESLDSAKRGELLRFLAAL